MSPPRPPMPIPGSMGLTPGSVRWIAFEWVGRGWSVCVMAETQGSDHRWASRYVRSAARTVIRDGGHAFAWACWGNQTREIF